MIIYDIIYGFTRAPVDCANYRFFQNLQIMQTEFPIPLNPYFLLWILLITEYYFPFNVDEILIGLTDFQL